MVRMSYFGSIPSRKGLHWEIIDACEGALS